MKSADNLFDKHRYLYNKFFALRDQGGNLAILNGPTCYNPFEETCQMAEKLFVIVSSVDAGQFRPTVL